jgi:hypothetical protein
MLRREQSPHQFKFSIGWDEADCPGGIKFVQPDTLVEMAVIKFDSIAATPLVLVNHKFIIQSKLALRSARQIGTHLDVTIDVGTKHVSLSLRIGI